MESLSLSLACLTIGLSSSFLHCTGMCGPMQMLLRRSGLWGAIAFHSGRISGYAILAALTSAILGTAVLELRSSVGMTAKVFLIAFYLIFAVVLWFGLERVEKALGRFFPGRKIAQMLTAQQGLRLFPAGMAMALLPCPTILAALSLAAIAHPEGGPHGAALAMTAFGIGTLPGLILLRHLNVFEWLRKSQLAARAVALFFLGSALWQLSMIVLYQRPCCH